MQFTLDELGRSKLICYIKILNIDLNEGDSKCAKYALKTIFAHNIFLSYNWGKDYEYNNDCLY